MCVNILQGMLYRKQNNSYRDSYNHKSGEKRRLQEGIKQDYTSSMDKYIINKRTNREENISIHIFSIGSFIYYKTQAEMCYKWIKLIE